MSCTSKNRLNRFQVQWHVRSGLCDNFLGSNFHVRVLVFFCVFRFSKSLSNVIFKPNCVSSNSCPFVPLPPATHSSKVYAIGGESRLRIPLDTSHTLILSVLHTHIFGLWLLRHHKNLRQPKEKCSTHLFHPHLIQRHLMQMYRLIRCYFPYYQHHLHFTSHIAHHNHQHNILWISVFSFWPPPKIALQCTNLGQ